MSQLDKVTDRVKELGELLAAKLSVDAEGTIKPAGDASFKDLFAGALPEDLTVETVVRAQDATQDYADGLALAVKKVGLQALKDNNGLASVTIAGADVGNDKVNVQLLREREGRNPQTGEVVKKHGVLSVSYVSGIGAKRGNLKRIQEATTAEAASIFGK